MFIFHYEIVRLTTYSDSTASVHPSPGLPPVTAPTARDKNQETDIGTTHRPYWVSLVFICTNSCVSVRVRMWFQAILLYVWICVATSRIMT